MHRLGLVQGVGGLRGDCEWERDWAVRGVAWGWGLCGCARLGFGFRGLFIGLWRIHLVLSIVIQIIIFVVVGGLVYYSLSLIGIYNYKPELNLP